MKYTSCQVDQVYSGDHIYGNNVSDSRKNVGYKQIKTLTALKRVLVAGTEYQVIDHVRPEMIGVTRCVSYANTQGFYAKILSQPEGIISNGNGGKGPFLNWGKAKYWQFEDNNVITRYDDNVREIGSKILVIKLKLIHKE